MQGQLGHEVRHLAYPFGSENPAVRRIASEAGYRSARSVRVGISKQHDEPMALYRVPVSGIDSARDFVARLHTARNVNELVQDATELCRRQINKFKMDNT